MTFLDLKLNYGKNHKNELEICIKDIDEIVSDGLKLDAYIKLSKSLYNYKKKYPEILEKAIELSKIINHSSYYTDLLEELIAQNEEKKSIDLLFSIPKQISQNDEYSTRQSNYIFQETIYGICPKLLTRSNLMRFTT